jgi:hypothetical protein
MLSKRDGPSDRIAGKRIGRLVAVSSVLLGFAFTGQAGAQVTGARAAALSSIAAAGTQPIVTTEQSGVAASAIAKLPQSSEADVAPVSTAVTQSVGSVVAPATKVVAQDVGSTTQSVGSVVAPATKVVAQEVGSPTQAPVVASLIKTATQANGSVVGPETKVTTRGVDKPRRPGHRRPSICELRFLRRRWLNDAPGRTAPRRGRTGSCRLFTRAAGVPARATWRTDHG